MGTRTVTLHATLEGEGWWPVGQPMQMTLQPTNLVAEANRLVNADGTGLVDAIKSLVDAAGDFQSAKMTADSYVRIVHASQHGNRRTTRERIIEVTALPSLADHVTESFSWYD